jgi:hypothetical protein
MVEKGGLDQEKTNTPSREEVSEWVIQSIGSMGTKIIRNSWRHRGFSYFPDEAEELVAVVDDGLGGDENDNIFEFDDDDDDSLIVESPFSSI